MQPLKVLTPLFFVEEQNDDGPHWTRNWCSPTGPVYGSIPKGVKLVLDDFRQFKGFAMFVSEDGRFRAESRSEEVPLLIAEVCLEEA